MCVCVCVCVYMYMRIYIYIYIYAYIYAWLDLRNEKREVNRILRHTVAIHNCESYT